MQVSVDASKRSVTQSASGFLTVLPKAHLLYARASRLLAPKTRTTPDEWARHNRVYPPTAGVPGPRDPALTPYVIPFARSVQARTHKRVVLVVGSQMGKSDSMLDIIGERMDTSPVPILYLGPTKQFLQEQWEPRVMDLLQESTSLRSKLARGKRMTKTRKVISGVPLRLAHGGSSVAIKSDPFGLALTDEADELLANVKGSGDPISQVDRRGDTYADFVHAITSTPTEGPSDVEVDPESGLEFWAEVDPQEVSSTIWRLWQGGTRYHWAWPCPHCGEYFIPRFKCLMWEKPRDASGRELRSDPAMARRTAYLQCPQGCADPILDEHKAEMNSRGVYVAPGQHVEPDGTVVGDPPDSWTISYWVSGLASPFKSWGERAAEYVEAVRAGEPGEIQSILNGGFGELWAPGGGDVPEWRELERLKSPYVMGQVPPAVRIVTAAVDVHPKRLNYVVRGWAARSESWLIEHGEVFGDTVEDQAWDDLEEVLLKPYDGHPIRLALIDSGFRPGKPTLVPENRVYTFCNKHARFCRPTKGRDTQVKPVMPTRREVGLTVRGKRTSVGMELLLLDTDYFKRQVHEWLRWPPDAPGAFHLPEDVSDDYLRQLVSEARIKKPGGKPSWVKRSKDNHFFDCFDSDTELLTRDGWKPVADAVSYDGDFATVNLDTDMIEYQPAYATTARHHDGEMVKIEGRRVDLLVTPNHRMVTTRRNPVDLAPRITLAEDLSIWHAIKLTAKWQGENIATIRFPETFLPRIHEAERIVDAGDWFEFLGWFVSEGHTKSVGRSRMVIITQNPGTKHDRIRALLDRLGFGYRLVGGRQFVVTSHQVFDAVSSCTRPGDETGCFRKIVPAMVKDAAPQLIERFIDAAILGDGWRQGTFRTYATVSKTLAGDMQELFLKIGRSGNVAMRDGKHIRDHSGVSSPQYHVSETTTPAAVLRRSDNTSLISRVRYDGMVYCVSVPNGTLIARRNGKAAIVGNCEAMNAAAAYLLGVQRLRELPTVGEAGSVAGAPVAKRNRMADYSAMLNR